MEIGQYFHGIKSIAFAGLTAILTSCGGGGGNVNIVEKPEPNNPPIVMINREFPEFGDLRGHVIYSVKAMDSDGVKKIEIKLDDSEKSLVRIYNEPTKVEEFTIEKRLREGEHKVIVTAYDSKGAESSSGDMFIVKGYRESLEIIENRLQEAEISDDNYLLGYESQIPVSTNHFENLVNGIIEKNSQFSYIILGGFNNDLSSRLESAKIYEDNLSQFTSDDNTDRVLGFHIVPPYEIENRLDNYFKNNGHRVLPD